jgi:two-component system, chemotaxis family, chemotaxis protein CheY
LATAAERPSAGGNIVIVDDSRTVQEILKVYLIGRGFVFNVATSAEEALPMIRNLKPVLIVSDINMGAMNGCELCKVIRGIPTLARTPIILVSSKKDEETKKMIRHSGADGFVSKPIDPDRLLRVVDQLVPHTK